MSVAMSAYVRAGLTMVNVVGALLLREVRVRFGASSLGYMWALVEPLSGILLFTIAFQMIGKPPLAGDSLALFFALSMLGYDVYRRINNQVGSALVANAALLTYPIVKPVDTFLARGMLEFATGSLNLVLAIALLMIVEDVPAPAHIDRVVGGVLCLAGLGFGMGCINATIDQYFASWRYIESVIQRPVFLMSGIFFTPASMPSEVYAILAWNPIIHGIEWMRYGYYEGYRSDHVDIYYLVGWGLVTTVVGLACQRYLGRKDV